MEHSFEITNIKPNIQQENAQQHYPGGALYVLATPIGNIGDLTFRAHHVLQLVDAIACEDTRHTAQLLARYHIRKPLFALHEHNETQAAVQIVQRLQQQQRIAYVSDAGTPGISDPGAKLVAHVHAAGLRVIPIPGVSALTAALSVAGLPHAHVYFAGFLPSRTSQRQQTLQMLLPLAATLVFYEAPHRICATVEDLAHVFPPLRRLVIARELTKQFEQIHTCTLDQASAWFAQNPMHQKGEFVLLLEGCAADENVASIHEISRILKILLQELSTAKAAELTARITGERKKTLYELALTLK